MTAARLPAPERAAVNCALGRIFAMLSRPTKPGDVAEYERCRAAVLDIVEPSTPEYRPNWARDGAAARGRGE